MLARQNAHTTNAHKILDTGGGGRLSGHGLSVYEFIVGPRVGPAAIRELSPQRDLRL